VIAPRSARAGFSLMEVVFAVAIVSTALLALQAVVTGGIGSAGNSVNRRAARELARAKLEQILAGEESAEGSGEVEERPQFRWTARTEELLLGVADNQTESVRLVIVTLEFPIDETSSEEGAPVEESKDEIVLATVLPDPGQGPGGAPQPQ